ncbi:MAG: metallophosphoesterase family protein, partial [Acidimicrobiales bacterium]
MTDRHRHFEPFLHLVDVTSDAALIAWGGFFLEDVDGRWQVVDDDDLAGPRRGTGGSIGAASPTYGPAVVELLDGTGAVVRSTRTVDANHAVVDGLAPDTEYRYRVSVNGEEWAADGGLHEWIVDGERSGPRPSERSYERRVRTHPSEHDAQPVTLLVWGDYGVGIDAEDGARQDGVARTLERLAATHPVRALVSLGDNIYHRAHDATEQ